MAKKHKRKEAAPAAPEGNGKPRSKNYEKQLRRLQSELLELQRNILTVNERLLILTDKRDAGR